jgi:hypothetical protein
MSDLLNDTKKHTTKSCETIPLKLDNLNKGTPKKVLKINIFPHIKVIVLTIRQFKKRDLRSLEFVKCPEIGEAFWLFGWKELKFNVFPNNIYF